MNFCTMCHRMVMEDYRYCPWCAADLKKDSSWENSLDDSCGKMERILIKKRNSESLDRIEEQLFQLEEEINLILSREKK